MKSPVEPGMVLKDDCGVYFVVTKTGIPFCHLRNLNTSTLHQIWTKWVQTRCLVAKSYKAKS